MLLITSSSTGWTSEIISPIVFPETVRAFKFNSLSIFFITTLYHKFLINPMIDFILHQMYVIQISKKNYYKKKESKWVQIT